MPTPRRRWSRPRRRNSLRWEHFHYGTPMYYGVTICVANRLCLLGDVREGQVIHSPAGAMVDEWWSRIPAAFPFVRLDERVVMPNHVHAILQLMPVEDRRVCPASLGDVIRWWKSQTTAAYAMQVREAGWPLFPGRLWQRGFYDRVLRDEDEIAHGRGYIWRNPLKWHVDPHNPRRG